MSAQSLTFLLTELRTQTFQINTEEKINKITAARSCFVSRRRIFRVPITITTNNNNNPRMEIPVGSNGGLLPGYALLWLYAGLLLLFGRGDGIRKLLSAPTALRSASSRDLHSWGGTWAGCCQWWGGGTWRRGGGATGRMADSLSLRGGRLMPLSEANTQPSHPSLPQWLSLSSLSPPSLLSLSSSPLLSSPSPLLPLFC